MQRLGKFDIGRRFPQPAVRVVVQLAFGTACAIVMIALRVLIDTRLPTSTPFALVYPTVLFATLYGHWRAGLLALLITFVFAWQGILPLGDSYTISDPSSLSPLLMSAISAVIMLAFAEWFRHVVLLAMDEKDLEIERRAMLMQELEHRTKNNFALVVSLLEMQRRAAGQPQVWRALDLATARVHSFARAYANLGEGQPETGCVAMRPYLTEVAARFAEGAFHEGIEVSLRIADFRLPREMAVAIALFVNEALTNCAKYAFPEQARRGQVEICLSGTEKEWEMLVADNGIGTAAPSDREADKGLGDRLMRAFAQRARADLSVEASAHGRRVRLVSSSARPPLPWRTMIRNALPGGKASTAHPA